MESINKSHEDNGLTSAFAALQALKAEPAAPPLPAHVQANLQRAFRAQTANVAFVNVEGATSASLKLSGWRKPFAQHVAPLLAIAVVAAGAAGIFMSAAPQNSDNNGWESPRPEGSPLAGKIGHLQAPFIALKDINLIALELNTTIVETQLSPMQLVRLGVPINPSNTASAVAAQVLVSDSGEALALKLDY